MTLTLQLEVVQQNANAMVFELLMRQSHTLSASPYTLYDKFGHFIPSIL